MPTNFCNIISKNEFSEKWKLIGVKSQNKQLFTKRIIIQFLIFPIRRLSWYLAGQNRVLSCLRRFLYIHILEYGAKVLRWFLGLNSSYFGWNGGKSWRRGKVKVKTYLHILSCWHDIWPINRTNNPPLKKDDKSRK